jgi:hypothetical protein
MTILWSEQDHGGKQAVEHYKCSLIACPSWWLPCDDDTSTYLEHD